MTARKRLHCQGKQKSRRICLQGSLQPALWMQLRSFLAQEGSQEEMNSNRRQEKEPVLGVAPFRRELRSPDAQVYVCMHPLPSLRQREWLPLSNIHAPSMG